MGSEIPKIWAENFPACRKKAVYPLAITFYFVYEMDKFAQEIIAENSLNPYELAIYQGLSQTRGSKAVKTKILSEAVTNVMNGNVTIDGCDMSVAEALTVKVVGDALANPTTSKLKDLATILGDVGATKIEVATSRIDADLAAAALGEDPDGD